MLMRIPIINYRICRSISRSYSTYSCCLYQGCVLYSECFEFCVVQVARKARPRPYGRGLERWCSACVNVQLECAHDGACMLGSEDGEADELL